MDDKERWGLGIPSGLPGMVICSPSKQLNWGFNLNHITRELNLHVRSIMKCPFSLQIVPTDCIHEQTLCFVFIF
jgi:hypothetical protein